MRLLGAPSHSAVQGRPGFSICGRWLVILPGGRYLRVRLPVKEDSLPSSPDPLPATRDGGGYASCSPAFSWHAGQMPETRCNARLQRVGGCSPRVGVRHWDPARHARGAARQPAHSAWAWSSRDGQSGPRQHFHVRILPPPRGRLRLRYAVPRLTCCSSAGFCGEVIVHGGVVVQLHDARLDELPLCQCSCLRTMISPWDVCVPDILTAQRIPLCHQY